MQTASPERLAENEPATPQQFQFDHRKILDLLRTLRPTLKFAAEGELFRFVLPDETPIYSSPEERSSHRREIIGPDDEPTKRKVSIVFHTHPDDYEFHPNDLTHPPTNVYRGKPKKSRDPNVKIHAVQMGVGTIGGDYQKDVIQRLYDKGHFDYDPKHKEMVSGWLADPTVRGTLITGRNRSKAEMMEHPSYDHSGGPEADEKNDDLKHIPGYLEDHGIHSKFVPGETWSQFIRDTAGKHTGLRRNKANAERETPEGERKDYVGMSSYEPQEKRYYHERPDGSIEDVTDRLLPHVKENDEGKNQGLAGDDPVKYRNPHIENAMAIHDGDKKQVFDTHLNRPYLARVRPFIENMIAKLASPFAPKAPVTPTAHVGDMLDRMTGGIAPTPPEKKSATPKVSEKQLTDMSMEGMLGLPKPKSFGISESAGVHPLLANTRLAKHLRVLQKSKEYANDGEMQEAITRALAGQNEMGLKGGVDPFAQIGERLAKDGRQDWANAYRWKHIARGMKMDKAIEDTVNKLVKPGQKDVFLKVVDQLVARDKDGLYSTNQEDIDKMAGSRKTKHEKVWAALREAVKGVGISGKVTDRMILHSLLRHAQREQQRGMDPRERTKHFDPRQSEKQYDPIKGVGQATSGGFPYYTGPAKNINNPERYRRDGEPFRFALWGQQARIVFGQAIDALRSSMMRKDRSESVYDAAPKGIVEKDSRLGVAHPYAPKEKVEKTIPPEKPKFTPEQLAAWRSQHLPESKPVELPKIGEGKHFVHLFKTGTNIPFIQVHGNTEGAARAIANQYAKNHAALTGIYKTAKESARQKGLLTPGMSRQQELEAVWKHPDQQEFFNQAKEHVANMRQQAGRPANKEIGIKTSAGLRLNRDEI